MKLRPPVRVRLLRCASGTSTRASRAVRRGALRPRRQSRRRPASGRRDEHYSTSEVKYCCARHAPRPRASRSWPPTAARARRNDDSEEAGARAAAVALVDGVLEHRARLEARGNVPTFADVATRRAGDKGGVGACTRGADASRATRDETPRATRLPGAAGRCIALRRARARRRGARRGHGPAPHAPRDAVRVAPQRASARARGEPEGLSFIPDARPSLPSLRCVPKKGGDARRRARATTATAAARASPRTCALRGVAPAGKALVAADLPDRGERRARVPRARPRTRARAAPPPRARAPHCVLVDPARRDAARTTRARARSRSTCSRTSRATPRRSPRIRARRRRVLGDLRAAGARRGSAAPRHRAGAPAAPAAPARARR